MISYQLAPENLEKERNTILQILNNNKYDTSILRALDTKKGNKHREKKTKWAKFTYIGRETRLPCFAESTTRQSKPGVLKGCAAKFLDCAARKGFGKVRTHKKRFVY